MAKLWKDLTLEERKAYYKKRQIALKNKIANMTPEEYVAYREKRNQISKNWRDKLEKDPSKIGIYEARYLKRKTKWSSLTPEQRQAEIERHKKKRENFTVAELEYERERGRTNVLRNKLKIISHYTNGEMRCMNPDCEVPGGAKNIWALSVDHINGGGCKHTEELKKLGTNFYAWLIKNNYPKGFQVICMNCNMIKKVQNREDYRTRQFRRNLEEERKKQEVEKKDV